MQKCARIFVHRHYLFREANSFPRAKLEENCELRGTDNVQGQISEHIFAPNGGYCRYYPSNLFSYACSFENWGYSRISPSFGWGMFNHVTCLDQSRASEKIRWIIDPLHKWRLNLNNNTWYILSLTLMFQDKRIFT